VWFFLPFFLHPSLFVYVFFAQKKKPPPNQTPTLGGPGFKVSKKPHYTPASLFLLTNPPSFPSERNNRKFCLCVPFGSLRLQFFLSPPTFLFVLVSTKKIFWGFFFFSFVNGVFFFFSFIFFGGFLGPPRTPTTPKVRWGPFFPLVGGGVVNTGGSILFFHGFFLFCLFGVSRRGPPDGGSLFLFGAQCWVGTKNLFFFLGWFGNFLVRWRWGGGLFNPHQNLVVGGGGVGKKKIFLVSRCFFPPLFFWFFFFFYPITFLFWFFGDRVTNKRGENTTTHKHNRVFGTPPLLFWSVKQGELFCWGPPLGLGVFFFWFSILSSPPAID